MFWANLKTYRHFMAERRHKFHLFWFLQVQCTNLLKHQRHNLKKKFSSIFYKKVWISGLAKKIDRSILQLAHHFFHRHIFITHVIISGTNHINHIYTRCPKRYFINKTKYCVLVSYSINYGMENVQIYNVLVMHLTEAYKNIK